MHHKLAAFGTKNWHMPEANQVSAKRYRDQFEETGFRIEKFLSIGDRVFPGFARCNVQFESIVNAIKTRGLMIGLGLTLSLGCSATATAKA